MLKYQSNCKTNYNQRKVDTNLEADNTFEITIKTTDAIKWLPLKIVAEWLQSTNKILSQKSSNNKLLQIHFKLAISMTIGYNSTMRIRHIKWRRSLNQGYTVPNGDKFWRYLPDSGDWWILYRPDKNFSWRQQILNLHQESNSFFLENIH